MHNEPYRIEYDRTYKAAYEEALVVGTHIGRITTFQEYFGDVISTDAELEALSLAELTAFEAKLHSRLQTYIAKKSGT